MNLLGLAEDRQPLQYRRRLQAEDRVPPRAGDGADPKGVATPRLERFPLLCDRVNPGTEATEGSLAIEARQGWRAVSGEEEFRL